MENMPSNFRSGDGAVTVAEMRVRTLQDIASASDQKINSTAVRIYLVSPNRTSAMPYSSPSDISMFLYASRPRPSMRRFCCRASRIKARSFSDGSASRGMTWCSTLSKNGECRECRLSEAQKSCCRKEDTFSPTEQTLERDSSKAPPVSPQSFSSSMDRLLRRPMDGLFDPVKGNI